jgi:hypothetical protein
MTRLGKAWRETNTIELAFMPTGASSDTTKQA